ncbi:MATE family efflux transporter [Acutalibacter caecimuris]|uniref:MATE family efflux transporter n=1 Tax=Acutalibacter caecimuris TaxID=3093657 RepID=UPI002AC9D906|nr:MATE family efflux transporter [Acutalibacter sp. M00118]
MTRGNPVRLLLAFAAPMLLGNVFQQLYSTVDAMVLGRGVGVEALAAAGATGSIHFFVFGFVTGLTHGYSVLVAQRFGAGDPQRVRQAVANAVYLAALSSLVITACSLLFSRPLLQLMGTPADIFEGALLYIRITFIGILATVFYNVLASVLRALGDSISPLVVVIISSLINVGLDCLFVLGLGLGIAGAAWATVLAQLLSGLMCLYLLGRMELMHFTKDDLRPHPHTLWELLRLGVPVGLMNSVTAIGGMILQGIVNGFGSATVAAYTASSRLIGLAEQPGSIIGLSLGTYVGQNLGAGRLDRVRLGVRRAIAMSLGINLLITLLLIFLGKPLTALFVSGTEQAIIDMAYPYLVIAGLMEWSLGLLFVYRFSLQSLGDTFVPLLSGALELGLRIGVVLFLSQVLHMGFLAICIADVSAWFGAAALLCAAYYIRMGRLHPTTQKRQS